MITILAMGWTSSAARTAASPGREGSEHPTGGWPRPATRIPRPIWAVGGSRPEGPFPPRHIPCPGPGPGVSNCRKQSYHKVTSPRLPARPPPPPRGGGVRGGRAAARRGAAPPARHESLSSQVPWLRLRSLSWSLPWSLSWTLSWTLSCSLPWSLPWLRLGSLSWSPSWSLLLFRVLFPALVPALVPVLVPLLFPVLFPALVLVLGPALFPALVLVLGPVLFPALAPVPFPGRRDGCGPNSARPVRPGAAWISRMSRPLTSGRAVRRPCRTAQALAEPQPGETEFGGGPALVPAVAQQRGPDHPALQVVPRRPGGPRPEAQRGPAPGRRGCGPRDARAGPRPRSPARAGAGPRGGARARSPARRRPPGGRAAGDRSGGHSRRVSSRRKCSTSSGMSSLPLPERRDLETTPAAGSRGRRGTSPPAQLGQVAVRGRDHADVHGEGPLRRHAPDPPSSSARRSFVCSRAHLADLVEEERPPVRQLEQARRSRSGPGERPCTWPKARSR